jgi:hypothetical protein
MVYSKTLRFRSDKLVKRVMEDIAYASSADVNTFTDETDTVNYISVSIGEKCLAYWEPQCPSIFIYEGRHANNIRHIINNYRKQRSK